MYYRFDYSFNKPLSVHSTVGIRKIERSLHLFAVSDMSCFEQEAVHNLCYLKKTV